MSRTSFICRADNVDATHFCLCEPQSVFLCMDCLPKHEGRSGHQVYPVTCYQLYLALGKDRIELQRRCDVSSKCLAFLNRLTARSEAVKEESQTLMRHLADRYMLWTEQQHLHVSTVVSSVREEIEMLLTSSQLQLSQFPELLVKQFNGLNEARVDNFVSVPEIDVINDVLQSCEKALSRVPRLWQLQLEGGFSQLINEECVALESTDIPQNDMTPPLILQASKPGPFNGPKMGFAGPLQGARGFPLPKQGNAGPFSAVQNQPPGAQVGSTSPGVAGRPMGAAPFKQPWPAQKPNFLNQGPPAFGIRKAGNDPSSGGPKNETKEDRAQAAGNPGKIGFQVERMIPPVIQKQGLSQGGQDTSQIPVQPPQYVKPTQQVSAFPAAFQGQPNPLLVPNPAAPKFGPGPGFQAPIGMVAPRQYEESWIQEGQGEQVPEGQGWQEPPQDFQAPPEQEGWNPDPPEGQVPAYHEAQVEAYSEMQSQSFNQEGQRTAPQQEWNPTPSFMQKYGIADLSSEPRFAPAGVPNIPFQGGQHPFGKPGPFPAFKQGQVAGFSEAQIPAFRPAKPEFQPPPFMGTQLMRPQNASGTGPFQPLNAKVGIPLGNAQPQLGKQGLIPGSVNSIFPPQKPGQPWAVQKPNFPKQGKK